MNQFEFLANHMRFFFVAFAISFVATPLMRILAVKNGIVDWPDDARKNHVGPVAYLGGVSLFVAWIGTLSICYFMVPRDPTVDTISPLLISLIFGAVCVALTGLVDDVYGTRPRVKIGGMFLGAGALALSSQNLGTMLVTDTMHAAGLSIAPLPAYILGAALIGLIVLGGCNSVNLLDGLDGLASGVIAIACMGMLVISMSAVGKEPTAADTVRFIMCLSVLGALMGFLPYNFNPANIFLGDAGSLLLGYLCASTVLLFAGQPKLVMAAFVVLALPVTDTALAIFRRRMRGQPIFSPDDQHIHHQLLRVMESSGFSKGMSTKIAVLLMYTLSVMFAVLGCALVFLRWRFVMAVTMPLFAFVVVGAYKLGQRYSRLADAAAAAPGENHASTGAAPTPH